MAVIRYRPGECVPLTGLYEIVGHYGEATGIAPRRLNEGDLFGPLDADTDAGPMWFVLVHEVATETLAA
jgi:hypothetical protein